MVGDEQKYVFLVSSRYSWFKALISRYLVGFQKNMKFLPLNSCRVDEVENSRKFDRLESRSSFFDRFRYSALIFHLSISQFLPQTFWASKKLQVQNIIQLMLIEIINVKCKICHIYCATSVFNWFNFMEMVTESNTFIVNAVHSIIASNSFIRNPVHWNAVRSQWKLLDSVSISIELNQLKTDYELWNWIQNSILIWYFNLESSIWNSNWIFKLHRKNFKFSICKSIKGLWISKFQDRKISNELEYLNLCFCYIININIISLKKIPA